MKYLNHGLEFNTSNLIINSALRIKMTWLELMAWFQFKCVWREHLNTYTMGNTILKRCFKDVDEAAWKQQNKELAVNPAYGFANLARGGSLIDAYEKDGPKEVERIAVNEMAKFFYHKTGEKHEITREEFIRWQWKLSQRIKVRINSWLCHCIVPKKYPWLDTVELLFFTKVYFSRILRFFENPQKSEPRKIAK